jgi:single-strand DNA-binding protein
MQVNMLLIGGNLCRDPEVKFLADDKQITSFSLAVNKKIKGEERVSFFDVTCFGKTAENCAQYLKKGSGVLIEGEIQQDKWETDGQKRSKVKIIAKKVHFVSRKTD